MVKPKVTFKDTCLSAVILALANMGDAFLYAYLPVNYQQIGVSSFWVGVILSINRFTRLFLNGWVAWLSSALGIKTVIVFAVVISSLITMTYGFISAIPLWIIARVLWGISFSTLRLGNTLHALEHQQKGLALGISRAVIETGPVLALISGPMLLNYAGGKFTFLTFGLISAVGVILAFPLTYLRTERVAKNDLFLSKPSSYNILVLINAFITEGVLVVLLVRFIHNEQNLNDFHGLAMAGLLLGYRRLSLVLFSPLSGLLADKWGFQGVFIYSTIGSAAGLILIILGTPVVGIITAFSFSAINASVATGVAIGTGNSFIKEVSDNSTWRDIGTATGAFAGSLLLPVESIRIPVFILLMLLVAGILYHKAKSPVVIKV